MHRGGGNPGPQRSERRARGGDNIHNEQEIISEVLRRIKPSKDEEERIISVANGILSRVREEVERRGVDADPVIVGSVAKGTFLKDPDVDVFIRFSPSYSREEMEKIGLEIARAVMPDGVESYAEHPYLRGEIEGLRVDIVPSYRIDDPARKVSSVDRTPFHTKYVMENLPPDRRDDVRLLKAFMKGIGVYGAEAKTRGFSGYLCELLVIKYGSFLNVLKAAGRWRKRVYIHLGNGGAKFSDPLVFIDPVDPNRNVASAVSEESKSTFIIASREFLRNPNLKFFFPNPPEPLGIEEIRRRAMERETSIYVALFPRPRNMIDDVLYPQIRRTVNALMAILQDFNPVNSFFYVSTDHIAILVEMERDILPAVEKHQGPPVWHENAEKFIERWRGEALRGPYIEGYRLYVDRMRRRRSVKEVLEKGLENYKLGKYFEKRKGEMRFEALMDILEELEADKLTEFFDLRFPWER